MNTNAQELLDYYTFENDKHMFSGKSGKQRTRKESSEHCHSGTKENTRKIVDKLRRTEINLRNKPSPASTPSRNSKEVKASGNQEKTEDEPMVAFTKEAIAEAGNLPADLKSVSQPPSCLKKKSVSIQEPVPTEPETVSEPDSVSDPESYSNASTEESVSDDDRVQIGAELLPYIKKLVSEAIVEYLNMKPQALLNKLRGKSLRFNGKRVLRRSSVRRLKPRANKRFELDTSNRFSALEVSA